jgi:ferredoxin
MRNAIYLSVDPGAMDILSVAAVPKDGQPRLPMVRFSKTESDTFTRMKNMSKKFWSPPYNNTHANRDIDIGKHEGRVIARNTSSFDNFQLRLNRVHSPDNYQPRRDYWLRIGHRICRWELFKRKQRRETHIIRKLRRAYGDGEIVLVYGQWVVDSGRLRSTKCDPRKRKWPHPLGMRLVRRFAREPKMTVHIVSEHWTSATCHGCGYRMTRCPSSRLRREEDNHTAKKLAKMRKGHVQIRGLSACTNCVCRRSRDAQAAKNIAVVYLCKMTGCILLGPPPNGLRAHGFREAQRRLDRRGWVE